MPQPSFEMDESRSVTPWVNRLYFESPRASSFLGLWLVKARHKNLVPLFSGVKPYPMGGSGRYAESIPVKSPITHRSIATDVKEQEHKHRIHTFSIIRIIALSKGCSQAPWRKIPIYIGCHVTLLSCRLTERRGSVVGFYQHDKWSIMTFDWRKVSCGLVA